MIGTGVLSQCKGWNFQNFPWDANYMMKDSRIVNVSMSMFGVGNGWREAFYDKLEVLCAKFV